MKALVTQLILIFFVLIIALIIFNITRAFLREKRISSFSLSKKDLLELSFFERINKRFWKIIHRLSKNLGNSKTINKYALNYDKYILTSEGNFKSSIDYITIKVVLTIISIVLLVLLIVLGTLPNNIFLLILAMIIGFSFPDIIWSISYYYKCNVIFDKLYESIIILSESLKKHHIEDAIVSVIDEINGPIKDEYKKVLIDISYNIPIKDAFLRFYERTKIKELKNIYHILDINSDNLYEAFMLIRYEFDYLNEKKYATSNINSVLNVLSNIYLLIPIIFVFMILIIYPDYFNIVKNYTTGFLIIFILVLIYMLLVLTIKSIMGERK